jgi:hypothetical protein
MIKLRTLGATSSLAMLAATAAGAAPSDACALLTPAQVSAILGATVGDGEPLMPTHREFCSWEEKGQSGGVGRNVRVSILSERMFTLGKTPMGMTQITAESGIGDEAYWSKIQGMVYFLSFRKGSTYVKVQSRTNPKAFASGNTPQLDEQDRQADRKLATEILKKL